MGEDKCELLQGTLDMLVLKILSFEPMHGWGISERIQHMSSDVFQVNQGSLYPALQRLKRKGWVRSEWRVTEKNRRARYYELTSAGLEQLAKEQRAWRRSSRTMMEVVERSEYLAVNVSPSAWTCRAPWKLVMGTRESNSSRGFCDHP